MRSIESGVVWRGSFAGAICGFVSAFGVEFADQFRFAGPSSFWQQLPFYLISFGVGAIATVLEITFILWDGTRSALRIGEVAQVLDVQESVELERMELSLVRAGLDVPAPRTPWRGIDPLLGSSRWQILFVALLYKLKIAGTSVIVKGLFGKISARLSGRILSRSVVELAAVPVFALWNAYICSRVMREARVRALGPSLTEELLKRAFPNGFESLDRDLQRACIACVRDQIIIAKCRHPNLIRMGHMLFVCSRFVTFDEIGEFTVFSALENALPPQKKIILEFFLIITVLDGKLSSKDCRMINRLALVAGMDSKNTVKRAKIYAKAILMGNPLNLGAKHIFCFE